MLMPFQYLFLRCNARKTGTTAKGKQANRRNYPAKLQWIVGLDDEAWEFQECVGKCRGFKPLLRAGRRRRNVLGVCPRFVSGAYVEGLACTDSSRTVRFVACAPRRLEKIGSTLFHQWPNDSPSTVARSWHHLYYWSTPLTHEITSTEVIRASLSTTTSLCDGRGIWWTTYLS